METWVVLSLVGAFVQNLRAALQKSLTGQLNVLGAAYTRFVYAVPFAWLYVAWLQPDVDVNLRFLGFALIGGVGQIAGTIWLLRAFTTRNFAVATALSKTETVQTVLLGALLLGEWVAPMAFAGILVSLVGVWLLGPAPVQGIARLQLDWGMVNGMLAGLGFAVAAVCYRGASLSLPELSFVEQAACTLAAALTLQTVLFGAWLALRAPGDLAGVARAWRSAIWVGLAGCVASACWFSAMALVNASYVRALGQIELLFSFAVSVLWFREATSRREVVGVLILSAGIAVLLWSRG